MNAILFFRFGIKGKVLGDVTDLTIVKKLFVIFYSYRKQRDMPWSYGESLCQYVSKSANKRHILTSAFLCAYYT
jgi:hypothetical protein